MLIKDIINKIDKNHKVNCIDFYSFCENQFELYLTSDDDSERFTAYWIASWNCTDSSVGYKVYFFDDKPVAISSQFGRKLDEDVEWLSKEDHNNVLNYAKTLIEEECKDDFIIADLNQDLGDTYKIRFCSQLFNYHMKLPYFNGEKVEIIEKLKLNVISREVLIKFVDGKTLIVEIDELDFPYNVIKN